jgi:hypothetical protein
MYCGMSLSRVGCDFRGLLVPAFEVRAAEIFLEGVAEALSSFGQMMHAHQWAAAPALVAPPKAAKADTQGAGGELPPLELLGHPPLAVLTNGLLAALNEIRHCAALSLRPRVAGGLEAVLRDAAGTLAGLGEVLEGPEREGHAEFCRAFREVALPYLADCLGKIYADGPAHGPALRVADILAPLSAI